MSEKELEEKFNNVIIGLINFISNCYEDSWFGENKKLIETFIESRPEEPIAYFLQYIYMNDTYRKKILEMDETFFLGQDFNEITQNKNEYIKNLFNFKKIWMKFDDKSKKLIKKSMLCLVKISEKYINRLYEIKIMKQNRLNIFNKIKEQQINSDEYSFDDISIGSSKCRRNKKK
jgi:hypothetical protein